MTRPTWVAIDGPSGSGKSTAARHLAQALRWAYLDTGATYRAATLAVLDAGVELGDVDLTDPLGSPVSRAACERAEAVVRRLSIESGLDPHAPTIRVDGRYIDKEIRRQRVTDWVSATAAIPGVRSLLVGQQREVAQAHITDGIVVEGRDIGAVVLPEAPLRVYLTADPAARARRRVADFAVEQLGGVAQAQADLVRRDTLDQTRADTPAGVAPGAMVVDSSELGIDEVTHVLLSLCRQVGIATPD